MITKQRQIYIDLLSILGIVFILLFGLSAFSTTKAQAVLGARELGIGQAITALPGNSLSVFANPAMMPEKERSVSFFGVRYYGLAEITDIATAITYPTKLGVFGAGVHRYGFDLFNESRLRLAYKYNFKGFRFGLIANYNHVMQGGEYGSAGTLGMDLGVSAPIIPSLWIGAQAANINRPRYGKLNDEELPRFMSFGLSYRLSEIALFSSDIFKDVRFPISYRGGIEVTIVERLQGRAGITTSPQTFSVGFGYKGSTLGANVAVQRHANSHLGYSPAIDLNIRW